jgi:hypothetical protein
MRVEETVLIGRPPEAVFDYVCDPANLSSWQTSKTAVEQITPGPPGLLWLVSPPAKPTISRRFAAYHQRLRDNLESA